MTDQLTPAAAARLAGLRDWYAMVDPGVKTFFEAFYQRDKVLTAAVLTYDEVPATALTGDTLEAALEAAAGAGALPRPDIVTMQHEGIRLAAGEKGTLRWTVRLQGGDLESWEDQIVVYGADGSVVHDEKVARAGLAAGGDREDTYELPVLGNGISTATVWVNVGGADQGQPAGPQGYRIGFPVTVVVGETEDTQRFEEAPQWGTFMMALQGAAHTDWTEDGEAQRQLADAVTAAMAFERLGAGFQTELNRVHARLQGIVRQPENWPAVQQRLLGITVGDPDQVGTAVLALVEIIDELTEI